MCIKVTFHLWTVSVWFVGKGCPDNILKKKKNREGNVKSRGKKVSVKTELLKIMTIKESWSLKLHHIEITQWHSILQTEKNGVYSYQTESLKPHA